MSLIGIVKIIIIAFAIYSVLACFLYLRQRSFLYFPTPENHNTQFSSFIFSSNGEQLKVWQIGSNKNNALLYFGGNAEAIENNLPNFSITFTEHTLYLVNYRGYGGSSGSPSEAGFYQDALALFDYIHARHQRVSVIGRSLGSGVANFLASKRPVDKQVLVTPYDSIASIAQTRFKLFPVFLLLKDKFSSINYAPQVNADTLILLSEYDEIVPRHHSDKLIQAFRQSHPRESILTVSVIEGSDHNTISEHSAYLAKIKNFISEK